MYVPILLIFFVNSSISKIIVTWGKLTDTTGCDKFDFSNDAETDCFGACLNDEDCFVAQADDFDCYFCDAYYFYPIQSLSEWNANGTRIGFKIDLTECPNSPNSTFKYENTTMTFSEGYWQILSTTTTKQPTTTTKPECQTGWTKFTREMGDWCMLVFKSRLSFQDASNDCSKKGGTLSGIENQNEKDFIETGGKQIISNTLDAKQGNFWVGAERLSSCRDDKKDSASCLPMKKKAFHWVDKFTTGTDMMEWQAGEPNYYDLENCVQMLIGLDSVEWYTGRLNDVTCSIPAEWTDGVIGGHVCGYKLI